MENTYQGLKKCVINDYPFEIKWDDDIMKPLFSEVYYSVLNQHKLINNSYYSDETNGKMMLQYIDHYVILCFRLANALFKNNNIPLAEAVYYSLRVRGSIDLFYSCEIGDCFMPVHALGTVMDCHAQYGQFFKISNGCHIGPYAILGKEPSAWIHPTFGDFVTMLAHSKVYGNTNIGNNVIISIGTVVINEEIPDNCIVSGKSPNLVFQKLRISNKTICKGNG